MKTPALVTRAQLIVGVPEHPCETIVRNGAVICPYEEAEVQFFPEHSGLYFVTLLGEPFEIFGMGGQRAKASLLEGHIPVVTHATVQKGCKVEQTVFACLLEGETIVDGNEKLINMARLQITNLDSTCHKQLPVTFLFGSCFRMPKDGEPHSYWKEFLLRDDIQENISADSELTPYQKKLTQKGNCLTVEDRGIVFCIDGEQNKSSMFVEEWGNGTWSEGTKYRLGWRVVLDLKPGETKAITYKLPYLPLKDTKGNRDKLSQLDFDAKKLEIAAQWKDLFERGSALDIPGTTLGDLWKAQTAATFILVDKQNKGSSELYGREMYRTWADNYPDRVLSYVHFSPSLYEFIWAQEASYWVMGQLDRQGYHKEVESYFEIFFELQGKGLPGVHDRAVLPKDGNARSFMGTTPHSWLNSTGGVLLAIAEHYSLTGNKQWIHDHVASIISACRWIKDLRKTTKHNAGDKGFGLMPPGQSTDATFASDHLQWYYTDIWTLLGLDAIAAVLKKCGHAEADEYLLEAADYKQCLLTSLDRSILDIEDFKNEEHEYDFSNIKFRNAMPSSKIDQWDEKGVPVCYKGNVILKNEAEKLGLKMFVPMSPQTRIPFRTAYLDNAFPFSFGLLAGMIDFASDAPICKGAVHSGRQIWQAIEDYCRITGLYNASEGIFPDNMLANDSLIKKYIAGDETEMLSQVLRFVLRYGCDRETHMGVENAAPVLTQTESWYVPCPATHGMAGVRKYLQEAIIYYAVKENTLVIGKAIPKEWMEYAASYETPILLTKAATPYGLVSIRYNINFSCSRIDVKIELPDTARLPEEIEVRLSHPQGLQPVDVKLNENLPVRVDKEKGYIFYNPKQTGTNGIALITAKYS